MMERVDESRAGPTLRRRWKRAELEIRAMVRVTVAIKCPNPKPQAQAPGRLRKPQAPQAPSPYGRPSSEYTTRKPMLYA